MKDSESLGPLAEQVNYKSRLTAIGILLFVAATAAVLLVRTPYNASDLTNYPDEVEYALAAHRLVNEGRYEIVLQGQHLPPRYPPWFSSLVIAPAYLIGSDPGFAIVPITLFAIAGVLLAAALGRQVSGPWGSVFAGLGVALLPVYWYWGRHVMTDVPCTVLILGACLVYVCGGEVPNLRSSLAGGVLIGLAALLRPPSVSCALPLLWRIWRFPSVATNHPPPQPSPVEGEGAGGMRRKLVQTASLLVPTALAGIATVFYNARTFGSPFRSGYHFWCAVPYDYRTLTFSLRYVRNNLAVLWQGEIPYILGALAVVVVVRLVVRSLGRITIDDSPAESRLAQFVLMGLAPLVLFYLVYFFPEARLQLPAIALLVVVTGAAAGRLVRLPTTALLLVLPAALICVAFWRLRSAEIPPVRRLLAGELREKTQPGSVIICATDPVYLEYMINQESSPRDISPENFWTDENHRRVVPLWRAVEYADKLLTPVRIARPNPPPAHWMVQRPPGLLAGGARDAVPWVANEQIDRLAELSNRGVPVFLETATLTEADRPVIDELKQRFDFTSRSKYFTELRVRTKP